VQKYYLRVARPAVIADSSPHC